MKQKISTIEIVFTAIVFIFACFGFGVAIHNRVDKGEGNLTNDNYTKYLEVDCSIGSNFDYINFNSTTIYYVNIKAKPHHNLKNVTISYSLENYGTIVTSGSVTATVEAGKVRSINCGTIPGTDKKGGSSSSQSFKLKVIVNSVSGTYKYIG